MGAKQIFHVWKEVFSRPKYWIILIVVALIFYSLNVFIQNYMSVIDFHSAGFFIALLGGFFHTIEMHTFISVIVLSVMLGFLVCLILYKMSLYNYKGTKREGILGSIGAFIAVFVPGCAACGVGLISLLGLGAALVNFFPFHGLELSIISTIILGYSIIHTTKNMYICKIKRRSK